MESRRENWGKHGTDAERPDLWVLRRIEGQSTCERSEDIIYSILEHTSAKEHF